LNRALDTSFFLIKQFCSGNNEAFITMYKSWLPAFYLIAYRYVQNQQDAEDIVADCFEKVFTMPIDKRHQKFIEEEINIKALLLVMVKNRSLDVIKTKKNRNRIVDGIRKFLPIEVFNGVKQTLTDENFKALLSCLPEKEKEVITLSIQGFSNTEIGKQLNLSEKTIANLLSMARKKVKNLWKTFME
jgi:RNA polymerase sigma factor (sigma-70 family)